MRTCLTAVAVLLAMSALGACGRSALAGEITGSYTNAYDGFSINIPIGWRVEPAAAAGATTTIYSYQETGRVESDAKITKIEIYVDPLPAPMSLREALEQYPLEPSVRRTQEGLMEISGHPALLHELQAPSGQIRMASLVHESKLVTVLVYGNSEPATAVIRSLLLR